LKQDIQLILTDYPGSHFLLGGDFNARIGDMETTNPPDPSVNALLSPRTAMDSKSNPRGRLIISMAEECGLNLLNGRIAGDIPSHFTFVSPLGKSTIDLIFASTSIL